jgi:hypothetical protein
VLAVLVVWSASVIADSGIFSTCTSEVVDRWYVGTALTAQTAIGPAAGALAMARLARHMTGPGNLPADTSAEGVDAHEQLAQRRPAAG